MQAILVMLCLLVSINCYACTTALKLGDILFQDLDCGYLCDGIGDVTTGYHGAKVSHVAMVSDISEQGDVTVIEADTPVVTLTPLDKFLARSANDNGQPRVMLGRLKPPYDSLIPMAIVVAKSMLGRPYNSDFHPNWYSQYCSQLLYVAFKWANHGQPIFDQQPMDYRKTGEQVIDPAWTAYFKSIGRPVTQGLMGISPAMLSLSPWIVVNNNVPTCE